MFYPWILTPAHTAPYCELIDLPLCLRPSFLCPKRTSACHNFLLTDASRGLKINLARKKLFTSTRSFHHGMQNHYPANFSGHNQYVIFKPGSSLHQGLAEPFSRTPLIFPRSLAVRSRLYQSFHQSDSELCAKGPFPSELSDPSGWQIPKQKQQEPPALVLHLSRCFTWLHPWGFQRPSTLFLWRSQNVSWLVISASVLRSVQRWLTLFSPSAPWCCLYLLLRFRSQPLRGRFVSLLWAGTTAAEEQPLWSGLLLQ